MIFEAKHAANILQATREQVVTEGRRIIGDRLDAFTKEEQEGFIETLELLADARVAELSGSIEAAIYYRTLKVALGEWKLAGKTEFAIVLKEVATTVLGIATALAGSALKALILAM